MTERINFHEIDKKGNHIMRLVGGDQEHRIDLMAASESMYEVLRRAFREPHYVLSGEWYEPAKKALEMAEGK